MSMETNGMRATQAQIAHRRAIHAPAVERSERARWPAGLEQQVADGAAAIDAMVAGLPPLMADIVRGQLAVQLATSRVLVAAERREP